MTGTVPTDDATYRDLNRQVIAASQSPDVKRFLAARSAADARLAELMLAGAPAPTLPCPGWCSLPAGHAWTDAEGGEVGRYHDLVIDCGDGGSVRLMRGDRLEVTGQRGEFVSHEAHVMVNSASDDLDAGQAGALAAGLTEGAALLAAG